MIGGMDLQNIFKWIDYRTSWIRAVRLILRHRHIAYLVLDNHAVSDMGETSTSEIIREGAEEIMIRPRRNPSARLSEISSPAQCSYWNPSNRIRIVFLARTLNIHWLHGWMHAR